MYNIDICYLTYKGARIMIYCKNCGRIMRDNELYCAQCGTKNDKAANTHKNETNDESHFFNENSFEKDNKEDPFQELMKMYPFMDESEEDFNNQKNNKKQHDEEYGEDDFDDDPFKDLQNKNQFLDIIGDKNKKQNKVNRQENEEDDNYTNMKSKYSFMDTTDDIEESIKNKNIFGSDDQQNYKEKDDDNDINNIYKKSKNNINNKNLEYNNKYFDMMKEQDFSSQEKEQNLFNNTNNIFQDDDLISYTKSENQNNDDINIFKDKTNNINNKNKYDKKDDILENDLEEDLFKLLSNNHQYEEKNNNQLQKNQKQDKKNSVEQDSYDLLFDNNNEDKQSKDTKTYSIFNEDKNNNNNLKLKKQQKDKESNGQIKSETEKWKKEYEEAGNEIKKDVPSGIAINIKTLIFIGAAVILAFIIAVVIFDSFFSKKTLQTSINDTSNSPVYILNDNKCLYFPKSEKKVQVDNMQKYKIINNGLMYYTSDNKLYSVYDGKEPSLVNDNVSQFNVLNQGKTLIYTKNNDIYILKNLKEKTVINDDKIKGANFYINSEETIIAKKNADVLYLSDTKNSFQQIDREVYSVLFVYNNYVYYTKKTKDNKIAVFKAGLSLKAKELFKVAKVENIDYNTIKPNGKLFYKDSNNNVFFFNGEKSLNLVGVQTYQSNIKQKDATNIRCIYVGEDGRYYAFDENTQSVYNKFTNKIVSASENFGTIACLGETGILDIFDFSDSGWKQVDLNIKDIKQVEVSNNGKRIIYINKENELYFLELGQEPIRVASNFQEKLNSEDIITTDNYDSIVFKQKEALYYFKAGSRAVTITKENVDGDFDLSKDGKKIIFIKNKNNLYMWDEESQETLIAENIKQIVNYNCDLMYYIDENNNAYSYNSKTKTNKQVEENIKKYERCTQILSIIE